MIPYFQGGYNEAMQYAPKSNKKIQFRCPDCGTIKDKPTVISDVYRRRSIGCICKDRKSYPEKFMKNVLVQLDIEHVWGFTSPWLKGYNGSRYSAIFDFYLPNDSLMIEMDGGLGHGKKTWKSQSDVGETLNKDKWKDEQANTNGIKVIRICADISDVVYLREQIQESLSPLFDLSDVDWMLCGEYATKNIAKVVCQYYEQDKSIGTIALSRHFGMDKATIRKYLKQGSDYGWCTYSEAESIGLREANRVSAVKKKFEGPMKTICEFYELHKPISTSAIAKIFNLNRSTVLRQLSRGHKLGISSYTPEAGASLRKSICKECAIERFSKGIAVYKDNVLVGEYASATEVSARSIEDFGVKLHQSCVSAVARGARKQSKGYTFKLLA